MVSNNEDLIVEVMWETMPDNALALIRKIDEQFTNWLPRLVFSIVRPDYPQSKDFRAESRSNFEIFYRFSQKDWAIFDAIASVRICLDVDNIMYYPYTNGVGVKFLCYMFESTGEESVILMLGINLPDEKGNIIGEFKMNTLD